MKYTLLVFLIITGTFINAVEVKAQEDAFISSWRTDIHSSGKQIHYDSSINTLFVPSTYTLLLKNYYSISFKITSRYNDQYFLRLEQEPSNFVVRWETTLGGSYSQDSDEYQLAFGETSEWIRLLIGGPDNAISDQPLKINLYRNTFGLNNDLDDQIEFRELIVDSDAPAGGVDNLPSTTENEVFNVSWYFAEGVSGINRYDVQYKIGQYGAWTDWKIGIKSDNADFNKGAPGETIYFRARAYDNVGNVSEYRSGNGDTYTKIQEPNIAVSPSSLDYTSSGGTKSFSVSSNTSWSVSDDRSWISVSPSSDSGDGNVNVSVNANSSTSSRSGTVTVSGGGITRSVTISQDGAEPTLSVSPSSLDYTSSGGTKSFSVTSNTSWSVSADQSWISVSGASGNGDDSSVSVNVDANSSTSSRSGTVTVSGGGLTRNITINQEGENVTLSVSPSSLDYTSSGGTKSFSVTSNTSWSVSDNKSWINVSGASGSGDDSNVSVNLDPNSSTSLRSGTVTVSGGGLTRTITINQEGENVTLSVSPSSLDYTSSGGTQSFSVSSNISWSVSDDQSWISVSPSSGSVDGSVEVTVAEHTGSSTRSGTVTVSGEGLTETVTISQEGTSTLSVTPTSLDYSASGGSQSFSVSSNTSWSVNDDRSWISVSPSSGSGDDDVSVTVDPNSSTSARSGTVTVSGGGITKEVTITQDPESTITLSVSPSSLDYKSSGGTKSFSVSSNTSWSVSDDRSWISVSPSSGSGDDDVSVTVDPNTSTSPGSGTVTVSGGGITKTVTVDQGGDDPMLTVSPSSLDYTSSGGKKSFSVTSNTSWSVSDDRSWISVSPSSGIGDDDVSVTVDPNTSTSPRSGTVTVSGGGITRNITITQSGESVSDPYEPNDVLSEAEPITYGFLSETLLIDPEGDVDVFKFTASANDSVKITAETFDIDGQIWLINSSGQVVKQEDTEWEIGDEILNIRIQEAGEYFIRYAYWANSYSNAKIVNGRTKQKAPPETGEYTLKLEKVSEGDPPTLTVSPTGLDYSASGGTQSFSVSSNISWSVSDDQSWISVSPSSGSNDGSVSVTVDPNSLTSVRSGTVTVSGDGLTETVAISQEGTSTLSVTPTSLDYSASGGTKSFSVSSNTSWSIGDDRSWISVSPASGSGDGSVEVTVPEHTGSSTRSGTVTVSGDGLTEIVAISQGGKITPPTANYSQGWNLVSIPEEISGQSLENYFSNITDADIYEFDGQYVEMQSLASGKGYWLKLGANEEVEFTGEILGSLTLSLETGWNLVGTIGDTLSIPGDIQDTKGIIENGKVWGLDYDDATGTYEIVETSEMVPGKGYFIKATSAGDIILSKQ